MFMRASALASAASLSLRKRVPAAAISKSRFVPSVAVDFTLSPVSAATRELTGSRKSLDWASGATPTLWRTGSTTVPSCPSMADSR